MELHLGFKTRLIIGFSTIIILLTSFIVFFANFDQAKTSNNNILIIISFFALLAVSIIISIIITNSIINSIKKIENNKETLRNVIEEQGEGVSMLNTIGVFIFANKITEEIFGVSANTLIGKNINDFVDREQSQIIKKQIEIIQKTKKKSTYEISITKPNNQKRVLLTTVSPSISKNNSYLEYIYIFRDITINKEVVSVLEEVNIELEQKVYQQTKQLKESEQKFSSLFYRNPIPLLEIDIAKVIKLLNKKKKEGITNFMEYLNENPDFIFKCFLQIKILNVNQSAIILLKAPDSEYLFDNLQKTFNKKTLETYKKALVAIAEKKNTFRQNTEYINFNGEKKTAAIQFSIIENSHRLLASIADTSKLKDAEIEIQKLFIAVEQSANLIMITDTEGIVEYVNKRFSEVTGYSKKEIIGKTPRILKSGKLSKKVYKDMWQTIKSGKQWSHEIQNRKKSGEIYWESTIITPIFNENREIVNFIGIKEDITDRKTYEKQTLLAILDAEEKQRKHFAEDLHDNLGPFLSGIKLYISQLEKKDIDQSMRLKLAENLNEMIDESIAITKLISNSLMPNILVDFGYIKAIESFINKINNAQNVNIVFIKPNKKKRIDKSCEIVIYRIIIELINNTLKHAVADTIKISILYNKNINVIYSDNGIGFDIQESIDKKNGNGLINIISRLKSINAHYVFNSLPNKGMSLNIEI